MFDSKQEYLKREWRECAGPSKMPLEKRAKKHKEQLILDTFLKTGGASKIYSGTWGCHWHWLWNLWHSVYRTKLEVSIHHGMFFYVSCLFHSLTNLIISFLTPFTPLGKQTYSKLMVGSDEHFLLKWSVFKGHSFIFGKFLPIIRVFARRFWPWKLRSKTRGRSDFASTQGVVFGLLEMPSS